MNYRKAQNAVIVFVNGKNRGSKRNMWQYKSIIYNFNIINFKEIFSRSFDPSLIPRCL